MIAKIPAAIPGAISLLLVVTHFMALPNGPINSQAGSIEQARVVYQERLREWRRYIRLHGIERSSLAEDYMSNEPFRRLLETGPVMIPWLVDELPSVFLLATVELLLRADWLDLAGYSERDALRLNVHEDFRAWWKSAPGNARLWFAARLEDFRAWLSEQHRPPVFADVRDAHPWKKLRNVGIFGLPGVMGRIRGGLADEYDYRLMLFWTDPLEYGKNGMPKLPREREHVKGDIGTAEYWIAWWEANSRQYWWLESPGK